MPCSPFTGRPLVIATMHGKEAVIASALEQALGVRCVLPEGFDTDRFGTFTGETPRHGSPHEAARAKARAAMAATGVDLAVASEGSFGPDPEAPLLILAHELVLLIDDQFGLEIAGADLGHDTNFAERHCSSLDAVDDFADRVGFPSHRLIVSAPESPRGFVKAIGERSALHEAARPLIERHGAAVVGTDMRACFNPTRMAAIGRAATALAERGQTLCPACSSPGFGTLDVVRGLPCGDCGTETDLVLAVVEGCVACDHRRQQPRPDGRTHADPGSCPWCNP